MLRHIDSRKMGRSRLGWLDSHFHFSFAEYYNPDNIRFGVLRVLNDDVFQPHTGFDTHPHKNMEIISYVVEGELTHADSMKNRHTLTAGQVQYMSAGTGVFHSEHNLSELPLRFLQIWILPDKEGYLPRYGDFPFNMADRYDKWLQIAAYTDDRASDVPVKIHSDINMYTTIISKDRQADLKVNKGRQAYLVLIEGCAEINGIELKMRDAIEIVEEDIVIKAQEKSHVLAIEMAKS